MEQIQTKSQMYYVPLASLTSDKLHITFTNTFRIVLQKWKRILHFIFCCVEEPSTSQTMETLHFLRWASWILCSQCKFHNGLGRERPFGGTPQFAPGHTIWFSLSTVQPYQPMCLGLLFTKAAAKEKESLWAPVSCQEWDVGTSRQKLVQFQHLGLWPKLVVFCRLWSAQYRTGVRSIFFS